MTLSHKILAIECTHQSISVAAVGHVGVVEETVHQWQRTAESIIPLADRVLAAAEMVMSDIDFLALSRGPGSFTALRIGMATAKGMAYGLGRPLVTVSTMEAFAASACEKVGSRFLVPVIPARKGEWYYAVYRANGKGPEEVEKTAFVHVDTLREILERYRGRCAVVAKDIGQLEEVCRSAGVDAVKADFFTAVSLIPIAEKTYMAGEVPSLEMVTPDYLQQFRSNR
ncbi:MAG: tRNA (adenosine(37)-N6)-threonylcarbamoyltransferase complex dimerization subunit type 1 TsaB [Chlorobium phaeobacteroides]|nr:tRNA (adenosine(37)-N6)-threonylcarbamoyltransferase complex dimerization subunit type 1 TsaB [Chlorobium phaeobacteroides]MBL6956183.1 tRNA (adenosine(37)-N6)-threonylcarbamoyltransferase complex dimerization subunit type 1 TsaB [Chlorobium phaeobacteroides]